MGDLDTLPEHIILKILNHLGGLIHVAKCGVLSRRWYQVSREDLLWRNAEFIGDSRLNLRQLTAFIRSPLAAKVVHLSLEGYIVRTTKSYSPSTITNHVLSLMGRRMEKLRSFAIVNANISNVAFKCMPKSLERLSLTGSIIGYCALDDLSHPDTLPVLRELNLDYVHNLSSNSKSFQHILQKKELTHLEVRHCNGISNVDLSRIPNFLVNLQILNLAEIKYLNDPVLKSISYLKNLIELYVAFTLVTNEGIRSLVRNSSKLVLLDVRGCPGVTGISLLTLSKMKSLREVWILRLMNGCTEARRSLKQSGSSLIVLDEIDRQKMAIPQRMDFYSIYFGNVLANHSSDEIEGEMQ